MPEESAAARWIGQLPTVDPASLQKEMLELVGGFPGVRKDAGPGQVEALLRIDGRAEPIVTDAEMTAGGLHRFHAVVQVKKTGPAHDGLQRNAIMASFGALKDLEQAQSDLVTAQGDLRSAEIALAASRNRLRILGRSDEEIARLEKVDRIGAETVVAAPINGTVIQRKVGLGQYITVGATDPVFTVGDLSTVWLVANVRESDAPKMKIGAAVEVTDEQRPRRRTVAAVHDRVRGDRRRAGAAVGTVANGTVIAGPSLDCERASASEGAASNGLRGRGTQ